MSTASNGGTEFREYRAGEWASVDGLAHGQIKPTLPDGPWPAMVELELEGPACSFGFTMTAEDAFRLARYLDGACAAAQERNRITKGDWRNLVDTHGQRRFESGFEVMGQLAIELPGVPAGRVLTAYWQQVGKFDPRTANLADRHYNRRKVGSPQFMPPGQTLILLSHDEQAVFGWWRPHPDSGIPSINGLDGWTCTIFRNESDVLSSTLIRDAERALYQTGHDIGPDGLLTYVWDSRVRSVNPGSCFKHAGWSVRGRSADGRKTLLWKEPAA